MNEGTNPTHAKGHYEEIEGLGPCYTAVTKILKYSAQPEDGVEAFAAGFGQKSAP